MAKEERRGMATRSRRKGGERGDPLFSRVFFSFRSEKNRVYVGLKRRGRGPWIQNGSRGGTGGSISSWKKSKSLIFLARDKKKEGCIRPRVNKKKGGGGRRQVSGKGEIILRNQLFFLTFEKEMVSCPPPEGKTEKGKCEV